MKWKILRVFQQERSGTMSWDREDEGDDRLIYDKNICWKFDMEGDRKIICIYINWSSNYLCEYSLVFLNVTFHFQMVEDSVADWRLPIKDQVNGEITNSLNICSRRLEVIKRSSLKVLLRGVITYALLHGVSTRTGSFSFHNNWTII